MDINKPQRRWLQFGLKSILVLTLVVAVYVNWWQMRVQNRQMAEGADRLSRQLRESEFQRNVFRVFRALDLRNAEQNHVLKNLKYVCGHHDIFTTWHWPVEEKRIDVVVFKQTGAGTSGNLTLLAVLLRENQFIDSLVFDGSIFVECHQRDTGTYATYGQYQVVKISW